MDILAFFTDFLLLRQEDVVISMNGPYSNFLILCLKTRLCCIMAKFPRHICEEFRYYERYLVWTRYIDTDTVIEIEAVLIFVTRINF